MSKTHVTLLCDRTGSMADIKADAEGAVNSFIGEQKLVEGECTLWLIDFDSPDYGNEADWFRTVHDGAIAGAPKYHLNPRGNTALYDSLARAIRETGQKLDAMADADKPERVIFVWQTDGMENASKETTLGALQEMIKHQEDVYSWVFIPLGSTLNASRANADILFGTQSFGNAVAAAGTGHSHSAAHSHVSSTVSNLRGMSPEQYHEHSYTNKASFDAEGNPVDPDDPNAVTHIESSIHSHL